MSSLKDGRQEKYYLYLVNILSVLSEENQSISVLMPSLKYVFIY